MASEMPASRAEFEEFMDARWRQTAESAGDFPVASKSWREVEKLMDEAARSDIDETHGKLTMYSLKGSGDVQNVVRQAWSKFFAHNAVFLTAMPSLLKMELEITQWVANLLGGGPEARAYLTSGGTESIFSGVKSARDWARENKPTVGTPEIVIPYSAHAAFNKSAEILGLKVLRVPLAADRRADLATMEAAISPRTIMLAGSAPSWPYGRYDDITGLGVLATKHGLWLHCDACLGGYLAPFVRELGYPIPEFDLRVPGLCSLSADLHKYGYAAKPASTILYPRRELARYQLFYFDDWASGVYPTYAFSGSRPGGAIAAAWAVINYLGREGYLRLARRTMEVKEELTRGIRTTDGLRPWETDLSILLYGAHGLDITAVAQGMLERGWFVMGTHDPEMIHLTVDPIDNEWIAGYLTDLKEIVKLVRSGELAGDGAALRYI